MTALAGPIRVLIADDTATSRELLRAILESDDQVEVVAAASHGREAVQLCERLRPDIVLMDVNMPVMDGYEATRRIMSRVPTPIVIVSAALTAEELNKPLEATRAGAVAVLRKPVGPLHPDFEAECARLLRTVRSMVGVKVVRRRWPGETALTDSDDSPAPAPPVSPRPRSRRPGPVAAIGIAASTGGPAALHTVLSGLPADFASPILVVQHIAEGFVEGLARWLTRATSLTVVAAEHGQLLQRGQVYLAPSGLHLGVSSGSQVRLSDSAPIHGFRPSASYLFETMASAFGAQALAVMLTGMGDDGVSGLVEVRARGGHVIVQDEASSVIFGMPGAAIAAGLADEILPLERIAGRLGATLAAAGSP